MKPPVDNLPRAIPMPDYVPTSEAIMKLFVSDDVVIRASEIIRRTGRGESSVRKSLTRLVREGRLFRVGLVQYGRSPDVKPIGKMRGERMSKIERRLEELERRVAELENVN